MKLLHLCPQLYTYKNGTGIEEWKNSKKLEMSPSIRLQPVILGNSTRTFPLFPTGRLHPVLNAHELWLQTHLSEHFQVRQRVITYLLPS